MKGGRKENSAEVSVDKSGMKILVRDDFCLFLKGRLTPSVFENSEGEVVIVITKKPISNTGEKRLND